MKPVKFPNRMQVSFSNTELDSIEQYANSRGIKKATAVKELAIRGLELTTKSNTEFSLKDKVNLLLSNLDINRSLFTINQLLDQQQYLKVIEVLNNIKNNNQSINVVVAVSRAIEEVSNHESITNMNNYLNSR